MNIKTVIMTICIYCLVSLAVTTTGYSANDVVAESALVAHYEFEQTTLDSSGSLLHGTAMGDPGYDTDSVQGDFSLTLDGIDDAVRVFDHDLLHCSQAITITFWVKPSETNGNNYAVYKKGAYFLDMTRSWDQSPHFYIFRPDGTSVLVGGNAEVQPGRWYHLAASYDSVTNIMRIYVNGLLEKERVLTDNLPIPKTSYDLLIGKPGWDEFFKGKIDDVRIYNTALNSADILDLYNSGVIPTNQSPAADAGIDRAVYERTEVTLDGTASFDPDKDDLSFSWTQESGPSVNLENPATVSPTFITPVVQESTELKFKLVVSDGEFEASDSVVITVNSFSDIIPQERRIDWNPGIPGGIPSTPAIFANVKVDGLVKSKVRRMRHEYNSAHK